MDQKHSLIQSAHSVQLVLTPNNTHATALCVPRKDLNVLPICQEGQLLEPHAVSGITGGLPGAPDTESGPTIGRPEDGWVAEAAFWKPRIP